MQTKEPQIPDDIKKRLENKIPASATEEQPLPKEDKAYWNGLKGKKVYKILALTDYYAATGYGTVSKNIFRELKQIFPYLFIDIVAVNYFGDMVEEDDRTTVVSAVKALDTKDLQQIKPGARVDSFGRDAFLHILNSSDDYDGIFIIQDTGVIQPMLAHLRKIKEDKKARGGKVFKSMFYFPVDCDLIPKLVEGLDFFDTLVTYNEYSRSVVLKYEPELRGKIKIIPHGIDTEAFNPIVAIGNFREEFFGANANKFIINVTNRNQPRKDFPSIIFAFQQYLKINPEAFLYLHTNPHDPMGWNLRVLLLQTDLIEGIHYMFPDKEIENHGASVKLLNHLYNASDLYLTTNRGEGWGLTVTEAMACKIPVIAPNHTSFPEMLAHGSRGWLLEELSTSCYWNDNLLRWNVCVEEVVEKIDEVQKSVGEKSYCERIQKAYDFCQTITWKELSKRWEDLFRKTF